MSGRYFALLAACLAPCWSAVVLSPSVVAKSQAFACRLPPHSDPGYISALSAANRFLQAWQNQDHETGLLMLTDDAKQHSSEEGLEAFFSSGLRCRIRNRARQES